MTACQTIDPLCSSLINATKCLALVLEHSRRSVLVWKSHSPQGCELIPLILPTSSHGPLRDVLPPARSSIRPASDWSIVNMSTIRREVVQVRKHYTRLGFQKHGEHFVDQRRMCCAWLSRFSSSFWKSCLMLTKDMMVLQISRVYHVFTWMLVSMSHMVTWLEPVILCLACSYLWCNHRLLTTKIQRHDKPIRSRYCTHQSVRQPSLDQIKPLL
jgi:hypothetical protein